MALWLYDISSDNGKTWTSQWLTPIEAAEEKSKGKIVRKRVYLLKRMYEGGREMDTVYLMDIVRTVGEWMKADFSEGVPIRVIRLLQEVYNVSVNELER